MSGASPTIIGNTIRNNGDFGVYLTASSSAIITNNTISGHPSYAVAMDANSSASAMAGNSAIDNGINGIKVSGILSINATWTSTLPYIIQSQGTGHVTIAEGSTLTLLPGTIIKGEPNVSYLDSLLTVQGTLAAEGTSAQPIYFTSINNDNVGGDTNSDSSTSLPSAGDWSSLYFTSTSTNNVLEHGTSQPTLTGSMKEA